jgi:hypothetical protein
LQAGKINGRTIQRFRQFSRGEHAQRLTNPHPGDEKRYESDGCPIRAQVVNVNCGARTSARQLRACLCRR